jgi:hypothetical protein
MNRMTIACGPRMLVDVAEMQGAIAQHITSLRSRVWWWGAPGLTGRFEICVVRFAEMADIVFRNSLKGREAVPQQLAFIAVSVLFAVTSARADLIAHWRGEGNANDRFGQSNGSTIGTAYSTGASGLAFHFDGIDDVVNIPDSQLFKLTGSFSIDVRIKPLAYTPGLGGLVFFRGDDRGGHDPYYIRLGGDGRLEFLIADAVDQRGTVITPQIPLNNFTHVIAAFDAATGRMTVHLNDALAGLTFTNVHPYADLNPSQNPGVAIGNITRLAPFTYNQPFNGLIDEPKLYNEPIPGFAGDFNRDDRYSSADLDMLCSAIHSASPTDFYDLNGDNQVNQTDLAYHVETLIGTNFGDTDLDGDVDLADLGNLASNFGQANGAMWADGDTDCDSDVDLADLGNLATHYGEGKAQALSDFRSLTVVPEPTLLPVFAAAIMLTCRCVLTSRRQAVACPALRLA